MCSSAPDWSSTGEVDCCSVGLSVGDGDFCSSSFEFGVDLSSLSGCCLCSTCCSDSSKSGVSFGAFSSALTVALGGSFRVTFGGAGRFIDGRFGGSFLTIFSGFAAALRSPSFRSTAFSSTVATA